MKTKKTNDLYNTEHFSGYIFEKGRGKKSRNEFNNDYLQYCKDLYRKINNMPDDWPAYYENYNGREQPVYFDYPDHIYNDFCLAINLGNTQDAIIFANSGMKNINNKIWDRALEDFCLAVDKDTFFHELFIHTDKIIYDRAIYKIKEALKKDIRAASKINLNNSEKNILPEWYKNSINNDFYIKLKSFTEKHGKIIFDNQSFHAIFSDYLNGEHKNEVLIMKHLLEKQLHKEIFKSKNVEKTRKSVITGLSSSDFVKEDLKQLVDIFCSLKVFHHITL